MSKLIWDLKEHNFCLKFALFLLFCFPISSWSKEGVSLGEERVVVEELCFFSVDSPKAPSLYMGRYSDRGLGEYIGGRVVYGENKEGISIVYNGTKVTNKKFQDYMEEWLEVVAYRVTGVYYFRSTWKGNWFGSSVEYVSLPDKKKSVYGLNMAGCPD